MFFDNWQSLLRILMMGVISYAVLIIILRAIGKRTLSKMSAFDMVITIALGSTLSTVILDKNIVLAEGVLTMALLVFLQAVVSFFSVRFKAVSDMVHHEPSLLLHEGAYCKQAMQDNRITRSEIQQALRAEGVESESQVKSVILEGNGRLSVIKRS